MPLPNKDWEDDSELTPKQLDALLTYTVVLSIIVVMVFVASISLFLWWLGA